MLLYMSRDYVGDMAETVSLLWPAPEGEPCAIDDGTIRISDAVERLRLASRADAPRECSPTCSTISTHRAALRCSSSPPARFVSGFRRRLAKQALADAFGLDVEQVEEVWHGLKPPYRELFDWGEGRGPQPTARDVPVFRPFMLAHPLERCAGQPRRLCRRMEMGRDPHPAGPCRRRDAALQPHRRRYFSGSFPDIAAAFAIPAVLDGELLVRGEAQGAEAHGGAAASFNALQQRLGRKNRQREDAGAVSGLRPPLRYPVRRRGGSAPAALDRAARAA